MQVCGMYSVHCRVATLQAEVAASYWYGLDGAKLDHALKTEAHLPLAAVAVAAVAAPSWWQQQCWRRMLCCLHTAHAPIISVLAGLGQQYVWHCCALTCWSAAAAHWTLLLPPLLALCG